MTDQSGEANMDILKRIKSPDKNVFEIIPTT